MKSLAVVKNLLIIFSIVAMVWWLHLQNKHIQPTKEHGKPQEYMSNITIANFDINGNIKERLRADYWAFIPRSGTSILQMPHVIVYKENGNVWHLSAIKALAWHPTMADKITQIDLSNNVVVERTAENDATPTKITTDTLQYFPPKEMLTTDAYIAMQQPGITISGIGMLSYIDQNWIELHDQISTIYQSTVN